MLLGRELRRPAAARLLDQLVRTVRSARLAAERRTWIVPATVAIIFQLLFAAFRRVH